VNGDVVLSTALITDGVEPHGILLDNENGIIYLANNVPSGVVVVRSQYPYLTWTDITYNHGQADGVKAIAKL
jgi:hypothetical protein